MAYYHRICALTILVAASAYAQFVQEGPKFLAAGAAGGIYQSKSVAVSADGTTAIIGADGDDGGTGSSTIWIRSGSDWIRQGAKLIGSGAIGPARQGAAVALSSDGNTALVGGPDDDQARGAVWVWTRTAGSWTQASKLIPPDPAAHSVGAAIALSGDGKTLIVGGPNANGTGSGAWIWTFSGGAWTASAKLVGHGTLAGQSSAVALSGDGSTALVGGPGAWVWTRSGNSWSELSSQLVTSDGGDQGEAVALSADGLTAAVGAPKDWHETYWDALLLGYFQRSMGAVRIFRRSGNGWLQDGGKLAHSAQPLGAFDAEGSSVALSADGKTLTVGGNQLLYFWFRSEAGWIVQGEMLHGSDVVWGGQQQTSVALTASGDRAIVGHSMDAFGVGAFWSWTRSGSSWSQEGLKHVSSDTLGAVLQGSSVALTSDATMALVGGPLDGGTGATWTVKRAANTWVPDGAKLVGTSSAGNPKQGSSVAVSADGSTAIIGGPFDAPYLCGPYYPIVQCRHGAVWVFTRVGGAWVQQAEITGDGNFGSSVALSADGNTAIIAEPGQRNVVYQGRNVLGYEGFAYVWVRDGTTWTKQATFNDTPFGAPLHVGLSADGNTAIIAVEQGANIRTRSGTQWTLQATLVPKDRYTAFPASIAISADGNTALVGRDEGTWMFARSGNTWTQQGSKFVGSDAVSSLSRDWAPSLALSANGDVALIGGDNSNRGAVWVAVRSGGVWAQQGPKIAPADLGDDAGFGSAVAISVDGKTFIVGSPGDAGGQGGVWTFRADRYASTTSLASSRPFSGPGDEVTFTATMTSVPAGEGNPSGSVTFYDDSKAIGTALAQSGVATLTTKFDVLGRHAITAVYEDSPFYTRSSSAVTQQVVTSIPAFSGYVLIGLALMLTAIGAFALRR